MCGCVRHSTTRSIGTPSSRVCSSGLADPAYQPYPSGAPGNVPELDDLYPYDPDKAMELLADAGQEDLTFEIVTLNIPSYVQLAEVVQGQLAAVGVTAEIVETTNVSQTFYVDANR